MKFTCLSLLLLIYLGGACMEQTPEQAEQLSTEGWIEVDGSQLSYVVTGEGKPCLVIGSSIYYPRTFSEEVYQSLKMYFVDMKWFAERYAPEPLDSVDIASIVEDVEQIRQALQLEKPLILGHSIHGTIAMEYVKQYQDQVSGLILIGSPSEWGNETYTQKAAALWETADPERKALQEANWGQVKEWDRLTGQEETARTYNNMSPQYWYNPRYDAGWLWKGMTVHSEFTQHLFTNVFQDYNMFDDSFTLTIPVFVGMGSYDFVIPHTLWQSEYSNIPDFTYILFEKSGHTPQLEEPQAFFTALKKWLK